MGTRDGPLGRDAVKKPSWGTGPGAIAPDGCAVEVYRRLRSGPEIEIVCGTLPAGSSILELGCGAGRMTHALVERAYRVTAVDESPEMLAFVTGARRVCSTIEHLELEERFDCVLLASVLINHPDEVMRAAFLRTVRRHLDADGVALIERHAPDRAAAVRDGVLEENDGIVVSLRNVSCIDGVLDATVVYEAEGSTWTQTFRAALLDDAAIEQALISEGLVALRWLNPERTWLAAAPSPPSASQPNVGLAKP